MKKVIVLQILAIVLAFAAVAGPEVALTVQPYQKVAACGNGSGCP